LWLDTEAQSGALCRCIRGQRHPSPSIAPDQDPIKTSDASADNTALPNFLLTRSVDQVGRKSEATLCIASLHFKISTLSGAATDQFELPSDVLDARHRQWG
jgi:hypothetical protein